MNTKQPPMRYICPHCDLPCGSADEKPWPPLFFSTCPSRVSPSGDSGRYSVSLVNGNWVAKAE